MIFYRKDLLFYLLLFLGSLKRPIYHHHLITPLTEAGVAHRDHFVW